MSKISLLVPTKGRVRQLQGLIDSLLSTTQKLEDLELVLALDLGDESYSNINSRNLDIVYVDTHESSMGILNTMCLSASTGNIIFLVNDDVVFRTRHWDAVLRSSISRFQDEIYLCYGNDLFKSKSLCTFPVISRRYCELVKEPFPSGYFRGFIDTHLFDIFKKLSRLGDNRIIYLKNLIFEHKHYRVGKSELDETYLLGSKYRFYDDSIFIQMSSYRSCIAHFLKEVISSQNFKQNFICKKPIDIKKYRFNSIFLAGYILNDSEISVYDRLRRMVYFFARDVVSIFSSKDFS